MRTISPYLKKLPFLPSKDYISALKYRKETLNRIEQNREKREEMSTRCLDLELKRERREKAGVGGGQTSSAR